MSLSVNVPFTCQATDGEGRPVRLLLTEGQQSDHKGTTTLLPDLPAATELLGDKGYDSDAYRAALIERGITPLHSTKSEPKTPRNIL
ncbi:MAG: transposase [Paracoccaceae bacterium]